MPLRTEASAATFFANRTSRSELNHAPDRNNAASHPRTIARRLIRRTLNREPRAIRNCRETQTQGQTGNALAYRNGLPFDVLTICQFLARCEQPLSRPAWASISWAPCSPNAAQLAAWLLDQASRSFAHIISHGRLLSFIQAGDTPRRQNRDGASMDWSRPFTTAMLIAS